MYENTFLAITCDTMDLTVLGSFFGFYAVEQLTNHLMSMLYAVVFPKNNFKTY